MHILKLKKHALEVEQSLSKWINMYLWMISSNVRRNQPDSRSHTSNFPFGFVQKIYDRKFDNCFV